jgi:hypothetical protein
VAQLGGGWYDPHDPESQPIQHARLLFLSRIKATAPEVLESLRDAVLPAYTYRHDGEPLSWGTLRGIGDRIQSLPPERQADALALWGAPDPRPLVNAMRAWAARYKLADDWLMDDALHTVLMWAGTPQLIASLNFHPDGWGCAIPEPRPLVLMWEPTMLTWAEFERQAQYEMQQYRAHVEEWAAGLGLKPSPEKNAPRRTGDAGLHFEWLVRYQVQGWTHQQIATHYRRSYATDRRKSDPVSRALRDTAALIGLTLR